jgi:hypothetical protein
MRADGTFDVDLDKDGKRDAWGHCTIAGDTMTIVGSGNQKVPKMCKNTQGVYHFKRNGDTLHFTLVSDPCQKRIHNMAHDWTKK